MLDGYEPAIVFALLAMPLLVFPLLQLLLFSTSASARTIIRRLAPELEATLLFPPSALVLSVYPRSLLGGFRFSAVFGEVPPVLQIDPRYRGCLAQARGLVAAKAACLVLFPVLLIVWLSGG